MATQRRPRKPLRSELSDGIRKNRISRDIKTIPVNCVKEQRVQTIEESDYPIKNSVEEVSSEELIVNINENDSSPNQVLDSDDQGDRAIENDENDYLGFDGSTIIFSNEDEEKFRHKAKDLGIKNWWNKRIENLLVEMEELQGD